jgi:hypothetical protein
MTTPDLLFQQPRKSNWPALGKRTFENLTQPVSDFAGRSLHSRRDWRAGFTRGPNRRLLRTENDQEHQMMRQASIIRRRRVTDEGSGGVFNCRERR